MVSPHGRRAFAMRYRKAAISLAGLFSLGILFGAPAGNPESPNNLRGRMPASLEQDVAAVVANLDRIEDETLRLMNQTTLDRQRQIRTLGKLLLFDNRLSVNQ